MGEQRELPILFTGPMVREILAGRKTQTRRVITPGWSRCLDLDDEDDRVSALAQAPYVLGDLLWVREPLRPRMTDGAAGYSSEREVVTYDADGATAPFGELPRDWPWRARYIASRYCPRWASRITLRVTEVRVERVQSITEEDARAEGCTGHAPEPRDEGGTVYAHRAVGTRASRGFGWAANPWVWVVTFEREEPARG